MFYNVLHKLYASNKSSLIQVNILFTSHFIRYFRLKCVFNLNHVIPNFMCLGKISSVKIEINKKMCFDFGLFGKIEKIK